MTNIYAPVFESGEHPNGFRSRRARIGYELGTELIGASLWEVPPGEAAYPYHFYYADDAVDYFEGKFPSRDLRQA